MRVEDHRFLTGAGCYSADVAVEGSAWAVVVRSPHAHADILAIDTATAEGAPGILGVFTGADLAAEGLGPMPCLGTVEGKSGSQTYVPPRPALAAGRVYFAGEPVVLVVAETQAQARDAAELVEVDYRDLPSVNETALALDPAAPQIWPEAPGNIVVDWETGDAKDVARAFDRAAHVTKLTVVNNRIAIFPMEPRACVGAYERNSGRFTLTTPSQGVHGMHSSRATNWSNARDGWSAQCRSSSTSTSGWRWDAVFRKAAMESNKRNRACSGSNSATGCKSGKRSRMSDTTSAMSAAPAPISERSCSGSLSRT